MSDMKQNSGIREKQRKAWFQDRKKEICLSDILEALERLDTDADTYQYAMLEILHDMRALVKAMGSTAKMRTLIDRYKPLAIPPEIDAGRMDNYLDFVLDDYGISEQGQKGGEARQA